MLYQLSHVRSAVQISRVNLDVPSGGVYPDLSTLSMHSTCGYRTPG
jgi:hypothetical protein